MSELLLITGSARVDGLLQPVMLVQFSADVEWVVACLKNGSLVRLRASAVSMDWHHDGTKWVADFPAEEE